MVRVGDQVVAFPGHRPVALDDGVVERRVVRVGWPARTARRARRRPGSGTPGCWGASSTRVPEHVDAHRFHPVGGIGGQVGSGDDAAGGRFDRVRRPALVEGGPTLPGDRLEGGGQQGAGDGGARGGGRPARVEGGRRGLAGTIRSRSRARPRPEFGGDREAVAGRGGWPAPGGRRVGGCRNRSTSASHPSTHPGTVTDSGP